VVVEDDDAVEPVVLGDVGGRGGVLAPDAAEDVGRGPLFGSAERVALGGGYLLVEVEANAGVERAGGAQTVEEGALQGDPVGDLDDALLGDGVDGAEGLLDPGPHPLRRDEAAGRGGGGEDASGEVAVLGGEAFDQGRQVRDPVFRHPAPLLVSCATRHIMQARRRPRAARAPTRETVRPPPRTPPTTISPNPQATKSPAQSRRMPASVVWASGISSAREPKRAPIPSRTPRGGNDARPPPGASAGGRRRSSRARAPAQRAPTGGARAHGR
jgi:hypothetical protein